MGFLARALLLISLVFIAISVQKFRSLTSPAPKPVLDENEYWGPGNSATYKENKAIKPFKVNVQKEVIDDLVAQLKRPLKYQTPLENVNFEYGVNNHAFKKVINYWTESYLPKWNERQQFLNQFPQFKTQIQGLNIHFIHVKPTKTEGKKVFPLLLLHGWPGSVREFYEMIPLLTTPNSQSKYVFEVIAPSLVGYGFSDAAAKVGLGAIQMAVVMRNLMLRVGHTEFFVQGGDWGSIIGSNIAALYPENVLGYHSNILLAGFNKPKTILTRIFPEWVVEKEHLPFLKPMGELISANLEESGYMHIQSTKPDTIGFVLLNNPAGLAAYILEKFSTWTNAGYKNLHDGGLTKRFTYEALLDNIMIYYITDSIATSQRLYAETFNKAQFGYNIENVPVTVPTGGSRFLHDIMHEADWTLKDRYTNLVHSTFHLDGGHFAALELPKVLYADFIEFIKKVDSPPKKN